MVSSSEWTKEKKAWLKDNSTMSGRRITASNIHHGFKGYYGSGPNAIT